MFIPGAPLALAAVVLSVTALFPLALADAPVTTCLGFPATIVGTAGDDRLVGTMEDDVIWAGPGNDVVYARGGNDVVCGGPGNDEIYGGVGDDLLLGQAGDDTLYGQAGDDTLQGGAGANLLLSGGGDDLLLGGPDPERLRGGPGADRLYGQGGEDLLRGGGGDDTLVGGDGNDSLHGGPGADSLHGGPGADRLYGGVGTDQLYGEAGDDHLHSGDGDDLLRGNDGMDVCDGGAGRDDAATCEQVIATEVGQVPRPLSRPGPTQVALTFDDGPSAVYTAQILDILKRYNVPATFFVIGLQAAESPALLRRMAAEGHSVQNHTWSHAWLTRYSDATIIDQLARTNRVVEEQTGQTPHCYRPPFGAVNDRVRAVAGGLGLTTVMWDVDPWDWKHPGPSVVSSHVLRNTGGGDVVLFHDTAGWSTVGALSAIIEGLRARGLEFVSICSTTVPSSHSIPDGVIPAFQPG